jgi:hypothetical protein
VLERRRPVGEPIAGLLIDVLAEFCDIHDGATLREVLRWDSPDQSRKCPDQRVRTRLTSPDLTGPTRPVLTLYKIWTPEGALLR